MREREYVYVYIYPNTEVQDQTLGLVAISNWRMIVYEYFCI